jgi:hypothetical protein
MPKIYSYFGDFIRLWSFLTLVVLLDFGRYTLVVTLWSLHLPNGIRRRPIHFIPLFNIIQTPK